MNARLIAIFISCLFLVVGTAAADTFRPAYLQLTERSNETYDVRWKTTAIDEQTVIPVTPVYPVGSRIIVPLATNYADGTAVMTGSVKVPGGLEGKQLRFEGLEGTQNQVLVRLIRADGGDELYKVTPDEPKLAIASETDAIGVSLRYTQLGIEHILVGFDHLLFIAALTLLVADVRKLVWTLTSFTLAHSITLALVTLDIISVPVPPVEAFIALSIVFVAVEVIRKWRGEMTLATRKPWLVAFAFGLLHGLGFASALAQVGLPPNNIPLSLLFFNVGVEIGQLFFVTALLALVAVVFRLSSPTFLTRVTLVGAYGIGGVASYWLIDRVSAFV
jgi:hydrogenase/urease accessory protein HupE